MKRPHPVRAVKTRYNAHFTSISRERLFLSSIGFSLTFLVVRVITISIHEGVGPFHDVVRHGRHIHHLVWGILALLLVGYLWLLRVGSGTESSSRWMSRLTALIYGIGAALTLDEFALWLNLRDVYWEREGRKSVEAVLFFGGLLSAGLWGRRFLRALVRDTLDFGRFITGRHEARK